MSEIIRSTILSASVVPQYTQMDGNIYSDPIISDFQHLKIVWNRPKHKNMKTKMLTANREFMSENQVSENSMSENVGNWWMYAKFE